MRTGGISTLGESEAADVVGTPGALDTADAVLSGAETGRDARARGETGAAAFAASGRAARATGSITAGIASGRRPTGRWPAGRLAMGRLSMMGTEVDVAVGSTRSEVDDRVTCARAGAAAPTRAERREETGFFDGDGDRFAGNIGVPDASVMITSAAAATTGGTTAGAATADGTVLGATFFGATFAGATFFGAALLSGTARGGTTGADPAALH